MTYLLILSALVVSAGDVEVETIDGLKTTGSIVDWTAAHVVVKANDGESPEAAERLGRPLKRQRLCAP